MKLKNQERKKYFGYERIYAPELFSFLKNPEGVSAFISTLKRHYDKRKQVFIILKEISEIDYGAIVVLLSILVKFKANNIKFNGDYPDEPMAKSLLSKSGFIESLFRPFRQEDRYEILAKSTNGIHTHAWKDVDSALGAEIIKTASLTIWGDVRRCQGVQRALIELMQNTNNHAVITRTGEKHWWLSVNHNTRTKKVSFSFVDFGVGVFTNLESKNRSSKFFGWTKKLSKLYKYGNNAELLKLILEGHLHQTVTGKHYRGKGLPGIAEAFQRNQISKLHIISNNVFCDLENNDYRMLKESFSGTFVYWEIGETNENCK